MNIMNTINSNITLNTMNAMIAIWGKNGSGKSTVASNLAGAYAKSGYTTALVGANRFYGAIQHCFNMEINTKQSLRALLSGGDSLSISDYFVKCPYEKNLFVASLADGEDCAGFRKMRVDIVVRFLNLVKKNYQIMLIDCDESIDDPLSMYSLTMSDKIEYVTRATMQSVVFAKAYDSIVSGLLIKDQISVIYIAGAASTYASTAAEASLYAPFGINSGYHILPYCKEIEQPRGNAAPIIFTRGDSRAAKNYVKEIVALAHTILPGAGDGQLPECDSTLTDYKRADVSQKRKSARYINKLKRNRRRNQKHNEDKSNNKNISLMKDKT